jgi:hypothetical protein
VRFAGELPTVEAPAGPVDLRAVPFDRLADYDRTRFPTPRPAFLSAWIAMPETVGLAALSDGRLGGYGVARRCRQGWKIGPLFADDETTAETLFTGLTARLGEGPVILDVPETNPAAVRLAERHGLAPVFETARMYAGPAPDIDPAGVFGITSFELG